MSPVASRTTRNAFWLLSSGLHSCASNCDFTSHSADSPARSEENSELHFSHTASMDGVLFTMRRLRDAMSQVYRRTGNPWLPVDFKRHHHGSCGFIDSMVFADDDELFGLGACRSSFGVAIL